MFYGPVNNSLFMSFVDSLVQFLTWVADAVYCENRVILSHSPYNVPLVSTYKQVDRRTDGRTNERTNDMLV